MNNDLLLSIIILVILMVGWLFFKHLHKKLTIYIFYAFFVSGILLVTLTTITPAYSVYASIENDSQCDDDDCKPGDDE